MVACSAASEMPSANLHLNMEMAVRSGILSTAFLSDSSQETPDTRSPGCFGNSDAHAADGGGGSASAAAGGRSGVGKYIPELQEAQHPVQLPTDKPQLMLLHSQDGPGTPRLGKSPASDGEGSVAEAQHLRHPSSWDTLEVLGNNGAALDGEQAEAEAAAGPRSPSRWPRVEGKAKDSVYIGDCYPDLSPKSSVSVSPPAQSREPEPIRMADDCAGEPEGRERSNTETFFIGTPPVIPPGGSLPGTSAAPAPRKLESNFSHAKSSSGKAPLTLPRGNALPACGLQEWASSPRDALFGSPRDLLRGALPIAEDPRAPGSSASTLRSPPPWSPPGTGARGRSTNTNANGLAPSPRLEAAAARSAERQIQRNRSVSCEAKHARGCSAGFSSARDASSGRVGATGSTCAAGVGISRSGAGGRVGKAAPGSRTTRGTSASGPVKDRVGGTGCRPQATPSRRGELSAPCIGSAMRGCARQSSAGTTAPYPACSSGAISRTRSVENVCPSLRAAPCTEGLSTPPPRRVAAAVGSRATPRPALYTREGSITKIPEAKIVSTGLPGGAVGSSHVSAAAIATLEGPTGLLALLERLAPSSSAMDSAASAAQPAQGAEFRPKDWVTGLRRAGSRRLLTPRPSESSARGRPPSAKRAWSPAGASPPRWQPMFGAPPPSTRQAGEGMPVSPRSEMLAAEGSLPCQQCHVPPPPPALLGRPTSARR
eukprot:TRINITY_DN61992_c0_g1_i1.p1 TRINITY_DN61992_c0_g1~~TRINITY_DN61992_c0_g1_i1.p1  ORF type:complete len:712 (-),score=104.89 TRINITY_DN61992_c0_g1_i1:46-2181(-)